MNLNKIFNSVIERVITHGKKKTTEAAGIALLLLQSVFPDEVAQNLVTAFGALWAAYKLYDKD
jgi:hypothetical protein